MGLASTNAIGSDIEIKNGAVTGEVTLCRGKNKVPLREKKFLTPLREAGIPFTVVSDYSDSETDLPSFQSTIAQGGNVFPVNAGRDLEEFAFKNMVGIPLREETRWFQPGVARMTYRIEDGQILHFGEFIPPASPLWLGDLGYYIRYALPAGALFVFPSLATLGLPLLAKTVQVAAESDASSSALGTLAMRVALTSLGGALGAGIGHFFVPKPGSPMTAYRSTFWGRSWMGFMTGTVPLIGALQAMDRETPFAWVVLSSLLLTGFTSSLGRVGTALSHYAGWSRLERMAEGKWGQSIGRFVQLLGYSFFR